MVDETAHLDRETFASRFGLLMTMIGVAVGLGNVLRFPYMVGRYGGASFVLFYLLMVFLVGIPALMAEWTLGRHTRRGTLGAFERGGLPGGRYIGYLLFFVVFCATGYYTNTIGWVLFHAFGPLVSGLGLAAGAGSILPPDQGFSASSFGLQILVTPIIILLCGIVLIKGLRRGIERVSRVIMPMLLIILLILIVRSLTLKGAGEGLAWYLGGFNLGGLTSSTMAAAMGQAIFSMSLGGTFMVIYGSYMSNDEDIPGTAVLTGLGDTIAGLLAGLAIFPAVFAFGLEPDSGPSLLFDTLPRTFTQMPLGWLFGLLFFAGLFGAAFLSAIAAMEVLIGGIVDNTNISRTRAVIMTCAIVMLLAIPSMINMRIYVSIDLFFGSGMQTFGTLMAVLTTAWCIRRSEAIKELSTATEKPFHKALYWWMRIVIPVSVLFVGIRWLVGEALG